MAKQKIEEPKIEEQTPVSAPVAVAQDGESEPNFEVSVKYGPTVRVYAKDAANAWEAYRQKIGMITAGYTPEIKAI